MEDKGNEILSPNPLEPRIFPVQAPSPGLTVSPGQVLWVHQADLLLPRHITVESDGEVVGRHEHLLGRQHHSALAGPEDASMLVAQHVVAGKGGGRYQGPTAPAQACCYRGDPTITALMEPGPPDSPGKEEPGTGALTQLWGRPVAVDP